MNAVETGRYTIGVFQDVRWAERGIAALTNDGFPPESFSVIARDSTDVSSLMESTLGDAGETLEIRGLGQARVRGSLVEALQGSDGELSSHGIAASMRRVGFQPHDGYIYETLTERGGVLVGVRTEPRAADALALLMAYGGGNAAIGAWTGRV